MTFKIFTQKTQKCCLLIIWSTKLRYLTGISLNSMQTSRLRKKTQKREWLYLKYFDLTFSSLFTHLKIFYWLGSRLKVIKIVIHINIFREKITKKFMNPHQCLMMRILEIWFVSGQIFSVKGFFSSNLLFPKFLMIFNEDSFQSFLKIFIELVIVLGSFQC